MLTDVFALRYANTPIWSAAGTAEMRLLVQTISLAKEIYPYRNARGEINSGNSSRWQDIHDRLARELGVQWLANPSPYPGVSPFGFTNAQQRWDDWDYICEQFVLAHPPASDLHADLFLKERISLIELVMRKRHEEISLDNAAFPSSLLKAQVSDKRLPMTSVSKPLERIVVDNNRRINKVFSEQCEELNERFRRASAPLSYHNGFIQISTDALIEDEIAKPFWSLLSDPRWINVDLDMKTALDERDSGVKDAAFPATRSLESAIKIISDVKGWTTGKESGASNYIDNLISKRNGRFLEPWEGELLKKFFSSVRNDIGHGAGSMPMTVLTRDQTDFVIHTAMAWIRLLLKRM